MVSSIDTSLSGHELSFFLCRMLTTVISLLGASLVLAPGASALDNGLARTPPMGFNTWNRFACDISEDLILKTVDAMEKEGLIDAGYNYINLDDCWLQHGRNVTSGAQVADPRRFPSGLKALGDKLHAKGLKFGIYSDSGLLTCAKFPGSFTKEKIDAQQYADWGVDYLKYDNCFVTNDTPQSRFEAMRDALLATGRPIVFSMCIWGVDNPWKWGSEVGHLWRTADDIKDTWESLLVSVDQTVGLAKYAGPGHWNDPDMLEVGNGGMTDTEYQAHFALWAILKAPLLIGCDVTRMSAATKATLLAKEVIAINQDELGVAGDLVFKEGPNEVYATINADGSRAVVFFNRHSAGSQYHSQSMRLPIARLGYPADAQVLVRDLYRRADLGFVNGSLTAEVPLHGVVALRVTPTDPAVAKAAMDWRPWN